MSKSPAVGASKSVSLSIDKAIFGHTIVGWSLNVSPIIAKFFQDQIIFVMPGGRHLRINFRDRLKPISDFAINSFDEPHFIALRPNAEVAGLKSFDSRFVTDNSEHDTRYITLFIDKDIDNIVDRIASLSEKYRLVMRSVTSAQLCCYDPFSVRKGFYNAKRKRSESDWKPSKKTKMERHRRHSAGDVDSESNWSEMIHCDWKEQCKSEMSKTRRHSLRHSRNSQSLSPAVGRRSRSPSRSDSGRSEPWTTESDHSPIQKSWSRKSSRARSTSRSHRRRKRVDATPSDVDAQLDQESPERSRKSRRASLGSTRRREHRSETERRRSRRSSAAATERRRRSKHSEGSDLEMRQRRRDRSRNRSTNARKDYSKTKHDTSLSPNLFASSSRIRRSSRRSRSAESGSCVLEVQPKSSQRIMQKGRSRALDDPDDTTDSETDTHAVRDKPSRRSAPVSGTESERSRLRRANRKLFSPNNVAARQRSVPMTGVKSTKLQKQGLVEADSVKAGSRNRRDPGCRQNSISRSLSPASNELTTLQTSTNRTRNPGAPESAPLPAQTKAPSSPSNGREGLPDGDVPVRRLVSDVRIRSKSSRSQPVLCLDSAESVDDEEITSHKSVLSFSPQQEATKLSTLTVPPPSCTPSSQADSDSGDAKSISKQLPKSSPQIPRLATNQSVISGQTRILKPGMVVYYWAPGKILNQTKRQRGKIVKVVSIEKRIKTKACLYLDNDFVLTVDHQVKTNARSRSPMRPLSEFTLISD